MPRKKSSRPREPSLSGAEPPTAAAASSSTKMPRKKASKRREPSLSGAVPTSAAAASSSTADAGSRDSFFADFSSGLPVASSPSAKDQRLEEYKNLILLHLEEEYKAAEAQLISVYSKYEKEVGNILYTREELGADLPFEEAVARAIELEAERKSKVSRKVTWQSNNSENMPPPSEFRRPRRSRSAEPRSIASHTTILSHRPRLSASTDRPGWRTPMTNPSKTFNFNIATVTPHPKFAESGNSMNVLRKPLPGELAISMGGSPLMVSHENGSSPSVTVPLADGRVFKVLGKSSPFKEEMRRGLDDETKKKLRQLKDFIADLV